MSDQQLEIDRAWSSDRDLGTSIQERTEKGRQGAREGQTNRVAHRDRRRDTQRCLRHRQVRTRLSDTETRRKGHRWAWHLPTWLPYM